MDLDWPYENEGKLFILYVEHISGSISKISNKLALTVILSKNISLYFN